MRESKTLYALLGWLMHESLTGYDLKKRCEEYLGDFWYGSFGQIYPLLHQMERDRLVTMREEPGEEGRPARKVYTITHEGRREFADWMNREPEPDLFRSELMLRLFFGRHAPLPLLVRHIRGVRDEAVRTLGMLNRLLEHEPDWMRNNPNAPFQRILMDRGHTVNEGFVEWCDRTLDELESLQQNRPPDEREES